MNDNNDKNNYNSDFILSKEEYYQLGEITCNLYLLVPHNTFASPIHFFQ